MNGLLRWCGWCCGLKYPLCCQCQLCRDCCRCPLTPLPPNRNLCPLKPLPCLPGPPPPTRVIREQVIVPIPYPVCSAPQTCLPSCWGDTLSPYKYPQQQRKRLVEPRAILQNIYECPWVLSRRLYQPCAGIMPGYKGHVPGLRFHAAGRTFGSATKDTCCIMSQWAHCCPTLPNRIFEQ